MQFLLDITTIFGCILYVTPLDRNELFLYANAAAAYINIGIADAQGPPLSSYYNANEIESNNCSIYLVFNQNDVLETPMVGS